MKQIKAILFDLDNTLVDFMKMKREACKSAISSMIDAGLKMGINEGYKKLFLSYMKVGIESDRAFTEFLKKETGEADSKILASGINAYLETKSKFLKLYPNIISTLEKLKETGLILGIVTDAPKVKAYQRLLAMKIEKYFDFVIGFEDTGKKKKTDIPLKMAIEKLKLEPEEIMMVGDSIKRDVIPAKKLGVVSVFAKYGSSEKVRKIKPDFELNTFKEITNLVLT
jgi:putative hydrolase of the HAD superfamily